MFGLVRGSTPVLYWGIGRRYGRRHGRDQGVFAGGVFGDDGGMAICLGLDGRIEKEGRIRGGPGLSLFFYLFCL